MGTSLTLFRAFGIDVRVHWSFMLALAYGAFMYSGGANSPLAGALYGVLVILLLFACVTLHEFGHALVAQYYKIKVPSITLLPIGGVATLERMPDKPLQEFMIAIAGPLVNVALAALLLPLAVLAVGLAAQDGNVGFSLRALVGATGEAIGSLAVLMRRMQTPGVANLLLYLVFTNVTLAIFNLLPAFPMDGGRILRALLAMNFSYVQATRVAVLVGRVIAIGLALWGVTGGGITLLLVAFFVYVGGGAEREAVESRAVLRHILASQALTANAVSLYTSERLQRAVDLIMTSYQSDYPVLDLGGRFVGVLTRMRLIPALQQLGPEARIVEVMIPAEQVPVCTPQTDLATAWEQMAERGSRVIAVHEGATFRGLITLDDISELFQVFGATLQHAGQQTSKPSATAQV